MSCEINSFLGQVDVHQIVDNSALNVTFMLVHQDLFTGIENLEKAIERDFREKILIDLV